jgi:hypothetical protein
VKFARIRPYKTFVVDDSGKRTRLDVHEIVLERPTGVDLEINLAPHPGFRGSVSFSTFRGSCLVVEPEAGDSLYLFIGEWPRGDRRRHEDRRRKRTPLCHVYAGDERGKKTTISARSFVVQLDRGLELKVDLTPEGPWAHHVHIQSSDGPLALLLGAANVIHVSVAERAGFVTSPLKRALYARLRPTQP